MIVTVKPAPFLKGRLQLPSSKSYSIRAFIVASCGGKSTIINSSNCEDAKVSMRIARFFGSSLVRLKNNKWKIEAAAAPASSRKINVKESGTCLRFLLPLLALRGRKAFVTGEGTLRGRPNNFLTSALRKMGAIIEGSGKNEAIPICIEKGNLSGGKAEIDGTLSSQFVSALLIACPRLEKDTQLVLKGRRLVSKDYITMTLQILKRSGIRIEKKGKRNYIIKGGQQFRGLKDFVVPSDYGLAAFMLAAAVLTKSDIKLTGCLKDEFIQADARILFLLKKMGVKFVKTDNSISLNGPFNIKGGDFSLKDCPDLLPIMSVLALFATGRTRLFDIKHARVKESDRISDLRKELLKVGANVKEKENELIIYPFDSYKENCLLDPHNDHRLAMAFCVFGLKHSVRIKNIECTKKSYPAFIRDFKSIGVKIS